MTKNFFFLLLGIGLFSCNPVLTKYRFIYVDEGPNKEIAYKMEDILENTFYNVDILLIEGESALSNIDSIINDKADFALIENYVDRKEGVSSAFSVYPELLHIFYKSESKNPSFSELMYSGPIYIGVQNSPTYNLMMDLFDFYELDQSSMNITFNMIEAHVVVLLTNILSSEELKGFRDFNLFSFESEEGFQGESLLNGIALKYPRLEPFTIPARTYGISYEFPIHTLSIDVIMITRSSLSQVPVNDFTKTMIQNKQLFSSIDPLLYNGMNEDFNRSKLNIPLHEGARTYFDRDEPGFFERYAELAGVILSILVALTSGFISLAKWQAQKKKDKIDEFYKDLLTVKNAIPRIKEVKEAKLQINKIHNSQNKAFEMLIKEELIANDSFRIFMDLSKETINDLRSKMRLLAGITKK